MRDSGGKMERVVGWSIAVSAVVACLVGGLALYTQSIVAGVFSAAQTTARGGDLASVRGWERFCPGPCPVEAQVAGGGARAAFATRRVGAARDDTLREAEALLTTATRTEPLNGDAWIQLSYAYALHDLGPSARGQEALKRSYETQPFSLKGGMWRIHFIGSYWPLLRPDLRAAAIEEARWRWSIHAPERPAILEALPNPDARGLLMARIAASPLRPY